MSDQHNRSVMGCSGDPHARTPNLDALAAGGIRFSSFYTNSPLCVPARSCFLNRRFPTRNRVWNNCAILPSDIPTWIHALSVSGYETAQIGRMHFDGADGDGAHPPFAAVVGYLLPPLRPGSRSTAAGRSDSVVPRRLFRDGRKHGQDDRFGPARSRRVCVTTPSTSIHPTTEKWRANTVVGPKAVSTRDRRVSPSSRVFPA